MNNWVISLLAVIFIIVSPTINFSQSDYKIEQMTSKDGLSHDCIQCVYQDSWGFIWIGTEGGLNKFDGYNITKYVNNPNDQYSISNNVILSIYEDPADSGKILWIGSKGGLNKFDRKTEKFSLFRPVPDTSRDLGNNHIECIYKDKSGTIWIAGSGLNKFDKKSGEFITFIENDNEPYIYSIIVDRFNNLWLGTDRGLLMINPNTTQEEINKAVRSPVYQKYLEGPKVNYILSVLEDKRGVLWIGSQRGLLIYERRLKQLIQPKFKTKNSLPDYTEIWSIFEDSSCNIWGSTSEGIIKINPARDSLTYFRQNVDTFRSLEDENYLKVSSLCIDRSGIMWAGTYCNGINKLIPNRRKFQHFKNVQGDNYSLGSNWVTSFYEDIDGILWIGTQGGHLNRYDKKRFLQIGSEFFITSVSETSSGEIWYISEFGLINYNLTTEKFNAYAGKGRSFSFNLKVYGDKNKNEQIRRQLFEMLGDNYSQYKHMDIVPIQYCYVDRSGIIWCLLGVLGARGGCAQFDPVSMKYIPYNVIINNREINSISKVFEDKSGTIWFGTDGDGLIKRIRVEDKLGEWIDKFVQYKKDENKSNTISDN
ncbi:two-component regulator propeller domain-containing protein, partial [Bacteroidota bacterium]